MPVKSKQQGHHGRSNNIITKTKFKHETKSKQVPPG